MFPEAKPADIVDLKDGETMEMSASLVRRTINGKTFLMFGYNGQYPGPLIKAAKGSTVIVEFKNEILDNQGRKQILCVDPSDNVIELFEDASQ